MRLGLMNSPARSVEDELRRIAGAGFDFVDLTLEPPGAWPVDAARLRRLLDELGLEVIGHTAYYLPIASPFPEVREVAHSLMRRFFETFAELGAGLVNVHPDPLNAMFSLQDVQDRNGAALAELSEAAGQVGVRVMLENLGRALGRPDDLAPILERAGGAGFHLDVGHAHMGRGRGEPNRTAQLIEAFGDRLVHVHVHDNVGVDDLHLPLGAGTVPWAEVVAALKGAGYDGTVTFEVFDAPEEYVEASRRLWLEWWEAG